MTSAHDINPRAWQCVRFAISIMATISALVLTSCERPPSVAPEVEEPAVIYSSIHDIIRAGDTTAFMEWLFATEAIDEPNQHGLTALHTAVRAGHEAFVHDLLEKGADRNVRDNTGATPLYTAARRGHTEIIRLLISAGANPVIADQDGLTPFDIAMMLGHTNATKQLAEARAKYLAAPESVVETPPAQPEIAPALLLSTDFRNWTSISGETIEAAFIQNIFDTVILQTRDGEMIRISLNRLATADQTTVRQLTGLDPHALASARARVTGATQQRDSISLRIGREKGWSILENCRLLKRSGNDGDSFHVRHDGKEYIFRLYFVDAAETSLSFPQRVRDQEKYFGLNTSDTLKLGHEATKFATSLLASSPFTVVTQWEDARGNSRLPRHYALVVTPLGDLDELLTKEGLVRQFGMPIRSTAGQRKQAHLRKLEREAQQQRVGAWKKSEAMARQ